MRRLLAVVTASVVGLACVAPTARAQQIGTSSFLVFPGGASVVSSTDVSLGLSGSLIVTFHGDPRTGCATRGLCGYSGVILWRPGGFESSSTISVVKFRRHNHTSYAAQLALVGATGSQSGVSIVVQRAVDGTTVGTCADSSSPATFTTLPVHGSRVSIRLLGGGSALLSSRCAGPLDADVAGAIPTAQVSVNQLVHSHRDLDLAGTHPFAASGFAGTVNSTLMLHVQGAEQMSSSPPPGIKLVRTRIVTEALTVIGFSGALTFGIHGVSDPDVCAVLDSCGVQGTAVMTPDISRQGELIASGPASLPYKDFLAALGASRRGRTKGITVFGLVGVESRGSISTNISPGGHCQETGSLGSTDITMAVANGRLQAGVSPPSSLKLRCPGPQLGAETSSFERVASGSAPIAPLANGRLTIRLRAPGSTFADDGYTGRESGAVSLTIKRGRLAQQIIRAPAG